MSDPSPLRRRTVRRVALLLLLAAVAYLGQALLRHPDTPLPDEWNLWAPLRIADPMTPITGFKLRRALDTPGMCVEILQDGGAAIDPMPDLDQSETCGIRDRVALRGFKDLRLSPVETACPTALRLALWVEHGIQPAARDAFGQEVARLHHFSSYSCREIRTPDGGGGRMSSHATASAIDISGVTLADGRRIDLLDGWDGPDGDFLRRVRDTACTWFGTTLGPEYNALHRDHFHLQNRGYGTCR